MKMRALLSVIGVHVLLPAVVAEDVPEVQVREKVTPWGTVVDRVSYYLKDGKVVEHGWDEMFSDDGVLQIRTRYAHGEADGLHQMFYEGTGAKQTESTWVKGVEHGPSRTWGPDGKLLFEGTWKNGQEWDGWFEQGSSGGAGIYHRHRETWKIMQWKEGRKVKGSKKEVTVEWRDWEPGRLPDPKMFCRWRWSRFMKRGDYPFLDTMPSYADVPALIEHCAKKEEPYQVAWEQLMTLTRVSFGNPWLQKDEERKVAADQWREWWQDVGRLRPELRKKRGVRDKSAWNLVRGERDLPVPEKAVVIPETYELKAHFGSGDYAGVTSETLTIKRSEDGAELVREFSTLRDGPVTEERWLPFGPEEADRLVRAIGYLVDQPWLLNDEKEIEKRYWEAERKSPKSESMGADAEDKPRGREPYAPLYYPGAGYELRDAAGKLWWNAEQDSWYGGNPERFNQSASLLPGVVFPFLAKLYPESERRKMAGGRGWGMK